LEAEILARHFLEKAWEYYDKPYLLHSIEQVHLFGGEGGVDCNFPLLRLAVVNGVCIDGTFT